MVLKKRQIFIFLTCLGCVNITTAAVLTNGTTELTTHEPEHFSDLKRNTSVCWADNIAYNNKDVVPGAGPCEQCVCEAPSIVCSMIKCDVKTGCKIIQKAYQCCPDYKCDCEYNGQTYDNGAKIDTPDTPCRVCYCKGGDIMCTTVGCYEREDCDGKIVPGTCCPKYDHCPPLGLENPKNRIKLTTANTVTLRNGKRGSQPWLLTTDSGHTVDAFSELTTVNEEPDYITETNPTSNKMITMILKRFNNNDSITWIPTTTSPPINDSDALKALGTHDFNVSTDSQNLLGASAVKEAINTIKVQSSTTTLNRTTFSLNEVIEARTELTSSSWIEENDSNSEESSEESKEASRPMFEIGFTSSGNDSNEESMERNTSRIIETDRKNESIFSTPGPLETVTVEYSTLTMPNFSTDVVTVVGNGIRNMSEPFINKKFVEGTTLTIQTIVTQIESGMPNGPEDTESAQVLFVEKGSNLSYTLSDSSTMSSASDLITLNVTETRPLEYDLTTLSSGEYTSESTEFQIGLHKNLSLFVDASQLNSTDFLIDLSTMTDVEATTVDTDEDDLDRSTTTFPTTTQTNNDFENLNQSTSTSTTDMNCTVLNSSDVEIFTKPISNITHENETSWTDSATEIGMTNTNPSETSAAVQSKEILSNTTETHGQLVSAANATNIQECAPETVRSSSIESNSSTINTSEQFDHTSSLYPVTTAENVASSGSTLFSANSSESVFPLKTTPTDTSANVTRIQNVTVTAASTQPPISYQTVNTKSSTETSASNDITASTLASKVTQNHSSKSTDSATSSTSPPIATNFLQTFASGTATLSPSGLNNSTTLSTFGIISPITPNTTLLVNGTLGEKDPHVQLLSQKYVFEPVKLISSVNSVYMRAGLGYREMQENHTRNTTTAIPPTISSYENTSKVENSKINSQLRSNSSVSAYKILLDGKVKPLTRPPNTTIAPLSWLKKPALSKNSTATTAVKSTPTAVITGAKNTASITSKPATSSASTARTKTIVATTSKSSSIISVKQSNATSARSISTTVSDAQDSKTANTSKSVTTTESTPGTNSTTITNATTHQSSSLKNESRQEPVQAKVYDPLMPYPEEYPKEYQTIQNGPAIIITRTTYTRIPDVTYTTVTMATLPTYARVQKAEENFANTLFDRKFGERSYERTDSEFGHGDGSPVSQSYFNIDVKKVDEKADEIKTAKNKRKVIHDNDQKFVIEQSEPISKEDEDVHILDEKDMKIVENFINKNLKL